MNKKEEFVSKLINDTIDKKIKWEIVSSSTLREYILNSRLIIKAFLSVIGNNQVFYTIQKYPDYKGDFDEYFDNPIHSINVVKDGLLAFCVSTDEVAEKLMNNLFEEIKSVTEDEFLKEFFKEE